MQRRTFRAGDDLAAFDGAVLCRDATISGTPRPFTIRRGTPLSKALAQLPAGSDAPPFEVLVPEPGDITQEEASLALARSVAGDGINLDGPHQGQVNLHAAERGLLRVAPAGVKRLNESEVALVATGIDGRLVEAGDTAAVVKAPALLLEARAVEEAVAIVGDEPLLAVKPFTQQRVALLAGTRIRPANLDLSRRQMAAGLARFGAEISAVRHLDRDDPDLIATTYRELLAGGAEVILVAGSIMLDPDDPYMVAAEGLRARLVCRGAPIDPGTMFWLAYVDTVPLFGLASCELYGRTSILDLLLPYALTGESITSGLIAELGYGGLLQQTQAARRPAGWSEGEPSTGRSARPRAARVAVPEQPAAESPRP